MNNILKNQESRWNEILFQGRNKNYGAYALRNESDSILTKSLLMGVSFLAAVAVTPLVINSFKSDNALTKPDEMMVKLKQVYDNEKKQAIEKPKPVVQIVAQKPVKTFDARLVTPTRNADESKLTKVEDKKDAVSGVQNNGGEKVVDNNYINTNKTTLVGQKPTEIINHKIDDGTVKSKVDVSADFIGGIDVFRNQVYQSIDGSGFEENGETIRTEITFVVEKDGTISGLKANGKDADFNKEVMRTIKSVKGKWKPALVEGEVVRSYFKFPVSLRFD